MNRSWSTLIPESVASVPVAALLAAARRVAPVDVGVVLDADADADAAGCMMLYAISVGMSVTAHTAAMAVMMLRSMRTKRRNTAASVPAIAAKSASRVRTTGKIHPNRELDGCLLAHPHVKTHLRRVLLVAGVLDLRRIHELRPSAVHPGMIRTEWRVRKLTKSPSVTIPSPAKMATKSRSAVMVIRLDCASARRAHQITHKVLRQLLDGVLSAVARHPCHRHGEQRCWPLARARLTQSR